MDKNNTIIQWNCRGLKANYNEILILISLLSPNILCLQETFLKPTDNIYFKDFIMFNFINNDCQKASGGSSILINKTVPHSKIDLTTNLQAIAAKVTLSKTFTICSIYIPPNSPLKQNDLENLVEQLPHPFMLVGDFNGHSKLWGCTNINNKGKIIEDFITENDLCLLNDNKSTYLHPATGHFFALDLCICHPNIFLDFEWSVHDDLHGSDHFPTVITEINKSKDEFYPQWNLQKANWEKFQILCREHLILEKIGNEDPITSFSNSLLKISTECIPKSSTSSKRIRPWFNDDCKNVINKRKNALRKFNKTPTKANLLNTQITRAKARRTIKNAKRTSWQKYVSTINSNTSMKRVWNMVAKINGKRKSSKIVHLNTSNNRTHLTKKDISNVLGENFQNNSSTSNYNEKFQKFKTEKEKEKIDFHSRNEEKYNLPFNMSELETALQRTKETATGPDQIHYQIIKHLPNNAMKTLLDIFNMTWESENFPKEWSEAIIIPIPKPGKDHTNPTNYRPIALTSCLCKTMERMINDRLVWFLESNSLITSYQTGFRKNKCTTDHLVRLETYIRNAFIKKEHLVAVFFDLEKAYDTTWKYGILKDLHDFGLKGHLPNFIANFLSNRNFKVRIGSTLSDTYKQEQGVPQGSILSPTLFNIKINSIVKCLNETDCSLYVDDFVMFYKSKNMETIEQKLQQCLNKLEDWANENGFKFSKIKTQCVHFCQLRGLHPDPNLTIYGSQIPVVEEVKFLGLIFDKKLTFIPHINYLRTKCLKALNILKVLSNTNWGSDCPVLINLYRSLIRSKLDYGSIVYGSARKSYLKKLDTIHHQGLRLALGAFRTSPVESLYAETNEPSLYIRREKLSLQYTTKLAANPKNPAFNCVFEPKNKIVYGNSPSAIKPLGLRIKPLLVEAKIDTTIIQENKLLNKEPWTLTTPNIILDLHLYENKKSETSPDIFKTKFLEIKSKYKDYISIYTDGSKRLEKVACAAVTHTKSSTVRLPDDSSIFSAETQAIDLALSLITVNENDKFIIFSDSLSVLTSLKQPNHSNPLIQQTFRRYISISSSKTVVFCWIPSHINIRGNDEADFLAKSALDLPITNSKIPHTDLKSNIRKYVDSKCQINWDKQVGNKLHEIKPIFSSTYRTKLNRKEQVRLTRCRIGHTWITHSYILNAEEQPICIPCDEIFTVKHFLLHCADLIFTRNAYFNTNSIQELFDSVLPSTILGFLKETHLINRL